MLFPSLLLAMMGILLPAAYGFGLVQVLICHGHLRLPEAGQLGLLVVGLSEAHLVPLAIFQSTHLQRLHTMSGLALEILAIQVAGTLGTICFLMPEMVQHKLRFKHLLCTATLPLGITLF